MSVQIEEGDSNDTKRTRSSGRCESGALKNFMRRNDVVSDSPSAPDVRTKAICWRRIFESREGSWIKFSETVQSDKT